MAKRKWAFLSNHGHILAYIAEHPQATTQFMSNKAGLSIRAVQMILDDLEDGGYITRKKVGRGNRYLINAEQPMHHRLEKQYSVSYILRSFGIKVDNNKEDLIVAHMTK